MKSNKKNMQQPTVGLKTILGSGKEAWFLRKFNRLALEQQQIWFQKTSKWIAEKKLELFIATFGTEEEIKECKYLLAASFWGTHYKEQERIIEANSIVEAWEGWSYI